MSLQAWRGKWEEGREKEGREEGGKGPQIDVRMGPLDTPSQEASDGQENGKLSRCAGVLWSPVLSRDTEHLLQGPFLNLRLG